MVEACAEYAWQGDVYWCTDSFKATDKLGIVMEATGITQIRCTLPPCMCTAKATYYAITLGYVCIRGL